MNEKELIEEAWGNPKKSLSTDDIAEHLMDIKTTQKFIADMVVDLATAVSNLERKVNNVTRNNVYKSQREA